MIDSQMRELFPKLALIVHCEMGNCPISYNGGHQFYFTGAGLPLGAHSLCKQHASPGDLASRLFFPCDVSVYHQTVKMKCYQIQCQIQATLQLLQFSGRICPRHILKKTQLLDRLGWIVCMEHATCSSSVRQSPHTGKQAAA